MTEHLMMMMMIISLILCIEGSWSKVIECQRKSTGQTLSRHEMTSWDKILKIGAKSFLKSTKVIHHKILKIGAKSFLKSTKVIHHMMCNALQLGGDTIFNSLYKS